MPRVGQLPAQRLRGIAHPFTVPQLRFDHLSAATTAPFERVQAKALVGVAHRWHQALLRLLEALLVATDTARVALQVAADRHLVAHLERLHQRHPPRHTERVEGLLRLAQPLAAGPKISPRPQLAQSPPLSPTPQASRSVLAISLTLRSRAGTQASRPPCAAAPMPTRSCRTSCTSTRRSQFQPRIRLKLLAQGTPRFRSLSSNPCSCLCDLLHANVNPALSV